MAELIDHIDAPVFIPGQQRFDIGEQPNVIAAAIPAHIPFTKQTVDVIAAPSINDSLPIEALLLVEKYHQLERKLPADTHDWVVVPLILDVNANLESNFETLQQYIKNLQQHLSLVKLAYDLRTEFSIKYIVNEDAGHKFARELRADILADGQTKYEYYNDIYTSMLADMFNSSQSTRSKKMVSRGKRAAATTSTKAKDNRARKSQGRIAPPPVSRTLAKKFKEYDMLDMSACEYHINYKDMFIKSLADPKFIKSTFLPLFKSAARQCNVEMVNNNQLLMHTNLFMAMVHMMVRDDFIELYRTTLFQFNSLDVILTEYALYLYKTCDAVQQYLVYKLQDILKVTTDEQLYSAMATILALTGLQNEYRPLYVFCNFIICSERDIITERLMKFIHEDATIVCGKRSITHMWLHTGELFYTNSNMVFNLAYHHFKPEASDFLTQPRMTTLIVPNREHYAQYLELVRNAPVTNLMHTNISWLFYNEKGVTFGVKSKVLKIVSACKESANITQQLTHFVNIASEDENMQQLAYLLFGGPSVSGFNVFDHGNIEFYQIISKIRLKQCGASHINDHGGIVIKF